MPNFQAPDLSAPLSLTEHLAMIPKTAQARGFFHQMIIDDVFENTSTKISAAQYTKLKMYPMSELNQLYAEAAQRLYPELPTRAGISLMARKAYMAYVQNSTLLKVLSAAVGKNPGGIFSSMHRVSSFAISEGSITAQELGEDYAIIQFRGYWLLDCVSIGNMEGLIQSVTGNPGRILVRTLSACDYDIKVEWG